MNLTKDHKKVIRELARNAGAMSVAEIISAACLPNQVVSKVLFELYQDKTMPLIAREEIEEGVVGYRCIADQILLESLLDDDEDEYDDDIGTFVAPTAQISHVTATPVEVAQSRPVEPTLSQNVTSKPIEMFGFNLGVDRTADTILQYLLKTPKNGSELLEEIDAPGDAITGALKDLEDAGLIAGVEMSDDRFYRMSDAINSGELEDLQAALNKISSYSSDNAVPVLTKTAEITSQPIISSPVAVSAPAPAPAPHFEPAPALVTETAKYVPPASGDDIGKVALREAKQREAAIAFIRSQLANGPLPKLGLSNAVVDIFTVRGTKELLAEMIESGELIESRESKTKYLSLGSRVAVVRNEPAPSLAPSIEPSPAPRFEPAPRVEQAPVVAISTRQELAGERNITEIPVRVSASSAQVAQMSSADAKLTLPVGQERKESEGQAVAGSLEKLLGSLIGNSDDTTHLVSTALANVAGYVRQLEIENKVYKDLFGKLALKNVG